MIDEEVAIERITESLPNWEYSKDAVFSTDDVIQAYTAGKQAGKNEVERILLEKLKSNLRFATQASEELINHTKSQFDILINKVYIKVNEISSFKSLCVVDSHIFSAPNFLEVYRLSREIKNKYSNETFHLCFSFLPSNNNVDHELLISDGFTFFTKSIEIED